MAILKAPVENTRLTLVFPKTVDAMVLGADTAEAYTVPANTKYVYISPTVAVWVRNTGTAAVPAGEVTDGSAPFLVPVGGMSFKVNPGSTLSFIRTAAAATTVTIARYDV